MKMYDISNAVYPSLSRSVSELPRPITLRGQRPAKAIQLLNKITPKPDINFNSTMPDPHTFRKVTNKPRVFILSDISNEPDDAESLVRYLLYSNEFDTRGLVACTSTWMKRRLHPEDMLKIIDAYALVIENLNCNVHPENKFPEADELRGLVATGPAVYGKEALDLGEGVEMSDGAKMLIERLEESEEPLWVLCWGGTNVLAQALQYVQQTRPPTIFAHLLTRLRVYAIPDQDDTGPWIRHNFPSIFYIASFHGWNQYGLATWPGISGEKFYGFDKNGPCYEKVSKEWIKKHIQVGPLGGVYPNFVVIPEGDTTSFLYLIQNGLGDPECPQWGSWGGRYILSNLDARSRHYADVVDRVVGEDGEVHVSNQATIWRWRDAFQNSFAARIQWTLSGAKTNHAPVVVVNGNGSSSKHVFIEAEAGTEIVLDCAGTYDPDGDTFTLRWFHYKDVTASQWWVDAEVFDVVFEDLDSEKPGMKVKVKLPPPEKCAVDIFTRQAQARGQVLHFVLEVNDDGVPPLTTYKRVVVQITNHALLDGRDVAAESVAEAF